MFVADVENFPQGDVFEFGVALIVALWAGATLLLAYWAFVIADGAALRGRVAIGTAAFALLTGATAFGVMAFT